VKLGHLHHLRGVAATAVAFSHVAHWGGPTFAAPQVKPRLLAVGDLAVLVFFMISGFLMVHVHGRDFGRPAALRDYAIRRVLRIYPAYWFFLAVTAILLTGTAWPRWAEFPREAEPAAVVGAITLVPLSPRLVSFVPTDWTLYHEVCFYAVVAAAIADRRLGVVVAAAWFGASAVAAGRLGFSVGKVNLFFLVGGVLAAARPWLARVPTGVARAVGAAAVVGVAATLALREVPAARSLERSAGLGMIVLMVAAVVAVDAGPGRAAPRPRAVSRLLDRLGDASYSVYLGHPLVQGGLRWLWGPPDDVAGLLLFGLAPAVVLFPAWRWIEAPAMTLGRRLCRGAAAEGRPASGG
jgi:exopolysaccharide production protein ExoZ